MLHMIFAGFHRVSYDLIRFSIYADGPLGRRILLYYFIPQYYYGVLPSKPTYMSESVSQLLTTDAIASTMRKSVAVHRDRRDLTTEQGPMQPNGADCGSNELDHQVSLLDQAG